MILSLAFGATKKGFPGDARGKAGDADFIPRSGREEGMAIHSVFLPGESHGQRSLVGYGP